MIKALRRFGGLFVFFSTFWFIISTPLLAEDIADKRIIGTFMTIMEGHKIWIRAELMVSVIMITDMTEVMTLLDVNNAWSHPLLVYEQRI